MVGTANKETARVTPRFADGSRKRLALRRPPEGWRYDGHMIGGFVRTTSRIVAVERLDANGHVAPGAQLDNDPACV